ncbi:MAG: hypothetical protein IJS28_06940 [Synergistaceae bacterium]|nr:hypothetical protein [Synergistaceae bacterium]
MNSERSAFEHWQCVSDDGLTWECPKCRAQFSLQQGNPETAGLNFCPVCGIHLTLDADC